MSQIHEISQELQGISQLIHSASVMLAVRKEVSKALHSGFVVTDGKHAGRRYAVVVKGKGANEDLGRRIRAGVPNVEVDKIAEDVLGVRMARRWPAISVLRQEKPITDVL